MHWTEVVDRRVGDAIVLELKGHLTLAEEERGLMRLIRELLDQGQRTFVLNLQHVSYIDSPGIGEIVGAYTRVTRMGGTLRICEASPRVRDVLRATMLDAVLELYEHEADALAG
jgi:anti-sigma B factor antagonist